MVTSYSYVGRVAWCTERWNKTGRISGRVAFVTASSPSDGFQAQHVDDLSRSSPNPTHMGDFYTSLKMSWLVTFRTPRRSVR